MKLTCRRQNIPRMNQPVEKLASFNSRFFQFRVIIFVPIKIVIYLLQHSTRAINDEILPVAQDQVHGFVKERDLAQSIEVKVVDNILSLYIA